jgi:hypothetical protein
MADKKTLKLKNLTHEAVSDLVHRNVMAIHVENYYDPALAKKIADKLCKSSLFGKYENAPNIGRVGQAYFEGLSSEKSAEKYRSDSRKWLSKLRSDCSPYILPIDRFRLEIDEAWGRGAKLGNLHLAKNLKAFAGLVRIFSQGSGTEIHLDNLAWDLEKIDKANTEVMTQLAVNVYLDVPDSGGEVKLWRISPDKKEYEKYRNKNSYGLDEAKMPKPDLIFKPKIGDLWLFRASELHQVVEAGKGRRVTQSCFVGFRGDDEYLIVWS